MVESDEFAPPLSKQKFGSTLSPMGESDVARLASAGCESSGTRSTMTDVLDPEISKGVDLVDCLAGFGDKWTRRVSGQFSASDCKGAIAKPVEHIDDFISHDWLTWGSLKFMTLCFTYNSIAAGIIGFIVALLCGTLHAFLADTRFIHGYSQVVAGSTIRMETVGFFGWLFGNLSFILMLLFWQRFKRFCTTRSHIVFMDKLCIQQTDAELKSKGIMSLAGFIRISDRLVILWSPRYFSRLWCVFEIASWMRLGKSVNKIEINPVAEGSFMSMVYFASAVFCGIMIWLARYERTYHIMVALCAIATSFMPLHIMRRNVRDLRLMPDQIKNFDFGNAQCFCCSVNHVVPGTENDENPVELPCDRNLIAASLEEWYKRSTADGTGATEFFNNYVRDKFGKHILKRVGGSKVRYTSAVIACLPGWFFLADRLQLLWVLDGYRGGRCFIYQCTLAMVVFPSVLRFVLEASVLFDRIFGVRRKLWADFLVTLLATIPTTIPTLSLLLALHISLEAEPWWPQAIITVVCVLVCLILYREDPIACYKYIFSTTERRSHSECTASWSSSVCSLSFGMGESALTIPVSPFTEDVPTVKVSMPVQKHRRQILL